LTIVIAPEEAGALFLDGPRRREARAGIGWTARRALDCS
jgi:hypothetical protein